MNTTPVHALTDIDGGIAVDPAPRLAGPPVFGGPGNDAFDLSAPVAMIVSGGLYYLFTRRGYTFGDAR